MTTHGSRLSSERGFAIVYTAVALTTMLLITGLAVDGGRAYVVKAHLTKAVDGAALGAARNLNSGDPQQEAARIFQANFPLGYLGTSGVTDPSYDGNFFRLETVAESGVNVITVSAEARLPTTFMRLANFDELTVRSSGEATRRLVDLSLVMDVSGSIGWRWPAVRDAARVFVNSFDATSDRLSLVFYSTGARVVQAMPASRGFNKTGMINAIPNSLPGGSTSMAEGLYRGWDELRTVPGGQQSTLRVIVVFTDGAANSVPGVWDATTTAKAARTTDFPDNGRDPDGMTSNNPHLSGLYQTETGSQSPSFGQSYRWDSRSTNPSAPWMPPTSFHQHRRSAGIPTTFPLQSSTLRVNGAAQSSRRGLRDWSAARSRYPAQVWNINNAARNLVEIIADAARGDGDGDYPIRIYTIGMGELVRYDLGTMPETSESILMRIANDKRSPDFNSAHLEGKYYFAETEADVGPAFQALQSQIIRLTK